MFPSVSLAMASGWITLPSTTGDNFQTGFSLPNFTAFISLFSHMNTKMSKRSAQHIWRHFFSIYQLFSSVQNCHCSFSRFNLDSFVWDRICSVERGQVSKGIDPANVGKTEISSCLSDKTFFFVWFGVTKPGTRNSTNKELLGPRHIVSWTLSVQCCISQYEHDNSEWLHKRNNFPK